MWSSALFVYDALPPALRRALREAEHNYSEETACWLLADGWSEQAVIDSIRNADGQQEDK